MTTSLYDDTDGSDYPTTIGAEDSTMVAVADEDAVAGFDKTWACTTSLESGTELSEEPADVASVSCGRFLPKYTKEPSADDLRFDAETDGQLGTTDGSTIPWAEAAEDTYEWTGAFQAATVAGAAALVALTF